MVEVEGTGGCGISPLVPRGRSAFSIYSFLLPRCHPLLPPVIILLNYKLAFFQNSDGNQRPPNFPDFFNLFKPMMNKHMLEKLQVFGNKEEERINLFKQKKFPMAKFPPRWGGTLKGEDEFCSQESVWPDYPIPIRYFREGNSHICDARVWELFRD